MFKKFLHLDFTLNFIMINLKYAWEYKKHEFLQDFLTSFVREIVLLKLPSPTSAFPSTQALNIA